MNSLEFLQSKSVIVHHGKSQNSTEKDKIICYELDLIVPYQRQLSRRDSPGGIIRRIRQLTDRAGKFRADILVEKRVVVENKAMKKITKQDEAQLINYLKTTRLRAGLLFNFGAEKFEMIKRIF